MFFRLPWWILAGLAVFLVTLVIEDASKAIERQVLVEQAIAMPQPATVSLWSFNTARDSNGAGEVHFSGYYRASLGVRAWEAVGPDMAYVPIFADEAKTVGAVLLVLKVQGDDVVAWLEGKRQRDGRAVNAAMTLGGVLKQTAHQKGIFAALKNDGFDVLPNAPVIAPFYQGRARGLDKTLGGSIALAIVLGAVALIIALIAAFKFVRWWGRGQKKPKHQIKPKRAPQPSTTSLSLERPKPSRIAQIPAVRRKKRIALADLNAEEDMSKLSNVSLPPIRRPFRLRTPEEIVDEVFGPNAGRDTPRRRF